MRRRNDPWDKPWVIIAAVAGIIAVVIIALVFFMSGGNNGGQTASAQSTTAQVTQVSSPLSTIVSGTGGIPVTIKEATPVTVPVTGAYVKVSYLGSFAGMYEINGEVENVWNSGERVFPLNGTTGAVSATFHKEDSSTRHEIVVELYKDGKALTFAKNTSAYGEVSVNYQL